MSTFDDNVDCVFDVASPQDLPFHPEYLRNREWGADDSVDQTMEEDVVIPSGEFTLLTYNVAGLPQGISSSNPEANIPLISPLLNSYDLVLVQEDFSYHDELISEIEHPYQSIPFVETHGDDSIGDGLNRFSQSPFGVLARIPWPGCHGILDCASDCLATKGFSVARHTFADTVEMDIYNLHMEAGGCPEDEALRQASITLLMEEIEARSDGLPVIVAGDYNLHAEESLDLQQLQRLLEAGFMDACWSVNCPEEHIDRIFFRSTDELQLTVELWEVPAEFLDSKGTDLSDHKPVAAQFTYQGPSG